MKQAKKLYLIVEMLHTFKVNFLRINCKPYLRKKYPNDSHGTILIRVTCERKNVYHNVYEYILEKQWNACKCCVRKNHPNAALINDVIQKELQKIQGLLLTNKLKGNDVSHAAIKALVHHKSNLIPLEQVVKDYIVFNAVTNRRASAFMVTLRHCAENGVPANIEQIKENHVAVLKSNLSKKLQQNSLIAILSRLKSVFNFAVKRELIQKTPMANIKLGEWETKKDFLSETELSQLVQSFDKYNDYQKGVAAMFIFCCYTGLRFSDAVALTAANITETENGPAMLFTTKKTKSQQLVPLLPQAVELLQLVLGKTYSNQYYNRTLKEIAKVAGIGKDVTSHLARHTFATLGSSKGIKLEVMQALLGHANIKTTQGYAKLMDVTKFTEIAKWHN